MTNTNPLPDRLERLGESLRAAAASDLSRRAAPATRRTGVRRRAALLALAVGVVTLPGAAIAANALLPEEEVARSMPAGTLALMGTDPTCTVVREGVEFDCTLARAPKSDIAPGAPTCKAVRGGTAYRCTPSRAARDESAARDWAGTVEPTVGSDQRVNGGCRSLNEAGTHWRCYVGKEAVRQQIIGAQFLGDRVTAPGIG